jgi:hypothetical protein
VVWAYYPRMAAALGDGNRIGLARSVWAWPPVLQRAGWVGYRGRQAFSRSAPIPP